MLRVKTCHDLTEPWHDSTRKNALLRHWAKRVAMAKTWHDFRKP